MSLENLGKKKVSDKKDLLKWLKKQSAQGLPDWLDCMELTRLSCGNTIVNKHDGESKRVRLIFRLFGT